MIGKKLILVISHKQINIVRKHSAQTQLVFAYAWAAKSRECS
jgi:hypothetical protein